VVDIVIRAKGNNDLTATCIRSIKRNTPEGTYRIILVDDGSEKRQGDVGVDVFVRYEESLGAVTATNAGLSVSLGFTDSEHVIVMDNDTEVPAGDRGWLERFIGEINEHPHTAAVGATTNYANPPQHILTVPQTYTADWDEGKKDNPTAVWFVSFCVLLRKDVIRQLGFWDERFNPGNWEDTDYAMQIRLAGWHIRVARSVYIHHVGHKTFGEDIQKLLAENRKKFLLKWGPGRVWDMGLMSAKEIMSLASKVSASQ
jgi:GT2 family glycosyltransferase